jgi:hypothetical protein
MSFTRSLIRDTALLLPPFRRLHQQRGALAAEAEALRRRVADTAAALSAAEATLSAAQAALSAAEAGLGSVRAELAAARDAARIAEELTTARSEHRLIVTEYPYHPRRRAIEQAAGGRQLVARFEAECGRYAERLSRIAAQHAPCLQRIGRRPGQPGEPFWENDWFPPLDAVTLYGLVAEFAPKRFIEVGSGMSTRFARRAIRDQGLATRIVSIDPHPHTEVDAICDEVIRKPVEDMPHRFWEGLESGDMLFVDNSHRSFPNSDVTVFFAETLPALPQGVVWGLHDILLPSDYPEEWRDRFYNEQYLLMAYLLGGGGADEILMPVAWASNTPSLQAAVAPVWSGCATFDGLARHGGGFWMLRGQAA